LASSRGEAGADLNTGRGGVPDSMIRDKPDRRKGSSGSCQCKCTNMQKSFNSVLAGEIG
jgi:hypothetical protein